MPVLGPAGWNGEPLLALLHRLVGQPARIHVLDPACRDLVMARLPGAIATVDARAVEVELHQPFRREWHGAPLVAEVMRGPSLIRFETRSVQPRAVSSHRVHLALPEHLHDVQRRRHERTDLSLPVRFHRVPLGPALAGQMINLGAGGLAFGTAEPVAVGEHLEFAFTGPDGLHYQDLPGQVIRVSAHQELGMVAAVQFRELHPAVEAALATCVAAAGEDSPVRWRGRISWPQAAQ